MPNFMIVLIHGLLLPTIVRTVILYYCYLSRKTSWKAYDSLYQRDIHTSSSTSAYNAKSQQMECLEIFSVTESKLSVQNILYWICKTPKERTQAQDGLREILSLLFSNDTSLFSNQMTVSRTIYAKMISSIRNKGVDVGVRRNDRWILSGLEINMCNEKLTNSPTLAHITFELKFILSLGSSSLERGH